MPSRWNAPGKGSAACTLAVATVLAAVGLGAVVHRATATPAAAAAEGPSGLREVPGDRTLEPGAALITVAPTTTTTLAPPEPPAPVTTVRPARRTLADLDGAPRRVDARVSAFGDSVMLEAGPELMASVSDLSLDAVIGRPAAGTLDAVRAFHDDGRLGDEAVVQVGNNGPVTRAEFDEIMSLLSNVDRVLVVNLKADREWEGPNNALLAARVERWPNAVLLDWNDVASVDPEGLLSDGVHLQPAGVRMYTRLILSGL